jgi:hypothetical protein
LVSTICSGVLEVNKLVVVIVNVSTPRAVSLNFVDWKRRRALWHWVFWCSDKHREHQSTSINANWVPNCLGSTLVSLIAISCWSLSIELRVLYRDGQFVTFGSNIGTCSIMIIDHYKFWIDELRATKHRDSSIISALVCCELCKLWASELIWICWIWIQNCAIGFYWVSNIVYELLVWFIATCSSVSNKASKLSAWHYIVLQGNVWTHGEWNLPANIYASGQISWMVI